MKRESSFINTKYVQGGLWVAVSVALGSLLAMLIGVLGERIIGSYLQLLVAIFLISVAIAYRQNLLLMFDKRKNMYNPHTIKQHVVWRWQKFLSGFFSVIAVSSLVWMVCVFSEMVASSYVMPLGWFAVSLILSVLFALSSALYYHSYLHDPYG